jgi:hypothetical protein
MRSFLFSAFLLILLPACHGEGEQDAASEEVSASGQSPVGETLTAPKPGFLEELRARTDPGMDALEAGVSEAPGDIPESGEAGAEDTTLGVPSYAAGGVEGSESQDPEGDVSRFPRPRYVRGIYLNAWTAGSRGRRARLIDMARRTELNTFVIDIKDASGYVSHDSRVPLARNIGATGEIRIKDLPALLSQLEEAGIYPIARIVVAKDPILAEERPDLAIQDSAGGAWRDHNGVKWLNLHHPEVWDYHVLLAREMVRAGFPEIQWDYVRFPDAPESFLSRAVYPGGEGKTKTQAVREFLRYSREILGAEGVQVTADVFGVTTSYSRDVGIGQLWESFIDQVDVALPMVYPSHYWTGSYGITEPNAYPYEIVRLALRDAVRRSALVEGAGATRPWLQDFTLGDPAYGPPEIRAQIQATYDAGIQEWILWNPGGRYTEAALIPARGLPSWLEPVMRVGGEVVAISKRFAVLGEEEPLEGGVSGNAPVLEEPEAHAPRILPDPRTLPRVRIPDTVSSSAPTPQPSERTGAREGERRDRPSPGAPGGCPLP